MPERAASNHRTAIWIERIVWNAAAGAALAVMILVLLGSLRFLDQVAPAGVTHDPGGAAVESTRAVVESTRAVVESTRAAVESTRAAVDARDRIDAAVGANRPSG